MFPKSCLPEVGEDETSLFTTAISAVYSERIFPLHSTMFFITDVSKQNKRQSKFVKTSLSVIQFLASSCKRAVNKIIWVWKASEFVVFGYKKHFFSETLWRNYFQLIMAVLFIFCRKEWLFISLEKKYLLKMHKYF